MLLIIESHTNYPNSRIIGCRDTVKHLAAMMNLCNKRVLLSGTAPGINRLCGCLFTKCRMKCGMEKSKVFLITVNFNSAGNWLFASKVYNWIIATLSAAVAVTLNNLLYR